LKIPVDTKQNVIVKTKSVSIVEGSSSPTVSKPYYPSPLTVKAGTSVTWTNLAFIQ
jgi:plastocyanin